MGELERLKERKEKLLRQGNARDSLSNLRNQRDMETKKLKAEIRALENPGSTNAKRIAKKSIINFGKSIGRGALKLGRRIDKLAQDEANARAAQNRRMSKKRTVKKQVTRRKR